MIISDLDEAKKSNDKDLLKDTIGGIKRSTALPYIRDVVKEAEEVLSSLVPDTNEYGTFITGLDRKALSEMRRYRTPMPIVHCVIKAALLLLGEDEKKTAVCMMINNFL